MNKHHDFHERLEFSMDREGMEYIDLLYKKLWPHTKEIIEYNDSTNPHHLKMQKRGIDKTIVLSCGKEIHIDEKVRGFDYGDILLEEYSVFESKKWGWMSRDKHTDYIAYIIKPSRRVFMLPFAILQSVWIKKYREWRKRALEAEASNDLVYKRKYGIIRAKNNGYTTTSFPIPSDELMREIMTRMHLVVENKN